MALFENYERRADKILGVLKEYGISSIEECKDITLAKGIDCDKIFPGYPSVYYCFHMPQRTMLWSYTKEAQLLFSSFLLNPSFLLFVLYRMTYN